MFTGNSKTTYWLIGVLITIIIAVGGFFVWQNTATKNKNTNSSSQNTANTNSSFQNNTNADSVNRAEEKAKTVVAPSTGKELVVEGVPTIATASTAVSAKGAYDLLLVEAKKWKEDAVLVNLKSDQDVALDGKSSTWEAHFISKGDLKKGWKATMKDKIVSDAAEEETNAKNIVEPPFTVDSGDAIKAGLGDLGATEVTVSSIRLFQETESGEWFWSIATDKGNITLKSR